MPSDSSTAPSEASDNLPDPPSRAADTRARAAEKGAATVRRHKEEWRADRLAEIKAQVEDGTLVVRQMTVEQHQASSQASQRRTQRPKSGTG